MNTNQKDSPTIAPWFIPVQLLLSVLLSAASCMTKRLKYKENRDSAEKEVDMMNITTRFLKL